MAAGFLDQTLAVIRKDLKRELRTREVLTTTVSFAVLLVVVFTFAFYQTEESVAQVFPGILWVAIVFSGTLAISRSFLQETDSGCLRALALIPGTHTSLYAAKLVTNLLFVAIFEVVLIGVLALAFDVALVDRLGWYAATVAAGTLGFTALGTLVSAMLVHNRLRDVLLPIVLYPLVVPLLIAGVKATGLLLGAAEASEAMGWVQAMLAIDGVFVIGSGLLFRWVLSAIE